MLRQQQQQQLQQNLDIANQFVEHIEADKTNYQADLAAVDLQAANLLADADAIDTLYKDVILGQGADRNNEDYKTEEMRAQIKQAKELADEARKVFAREDGITIPVIERQILKRTVSDLDKETMVVGLKYAWASIQNPLDLANTKKLKALRDDLRENGKELGKASLAPKIIAGLLIGAAVLAVAAIATLSVASIFISAGTLTPAVIASLPLVPAFFAKLAFAGSGFLGLAASGASNVLGAFFAGATVSGAAVGFTAAGVTGTALGGAAALTLAKNETGLTRSTASLFSNTLTRGGKKGKELVENELSAHDDLAKARDERISYGVR